MGTGPNLRALTGPAAQGARAVATPLAVLAVSVVVDRIGRRLADLPVDRLDDASLTVAAVRSSPLVIGGGIAVLVAVAIAGRGRLLVRWSDLEHGRAQQVLVALCGGLLAWRYSTTAYDYLFGQWHTVDRVLLVVLALAAILRPVALLGLIPVVRIVRAPFLVPFAFSPAQNVDQLLLLVLAVIAAGFLVHAVSGRSVAPSVLGLTVAVVAMHFFVPGRAKLDLGWYGADDLDQLPLNGHAQGWLGAGDGAWARRLSRGFEASAPVLRAATVVLELGAVLAVLRRRLAVAWLTGFVGFHVAVGAALGFSFLDWLVVEAALLVILAHPHHRDLVNAAFRPGVAAVAIATVVVGGRVLDPPRLAWIDGPLVYDYEIDAVDANGRRVALHADDFAPYGQAFAFGALPLGPRPPLANGYGAIDPVALDALAGVETLDDLDAVERDAARTAGSTGTSSDAAAEAVWLLERFLDSTARCVAPGDRLPAPPRHFWTDRPGTDWDGTTPLVRLEVERVTTLRTDDGELHRREPVVVIERDGVDHTVTFASVPLG